MANEIKYISLDDLLYYHRGLKNKFSTISALNSAISRIGTLENTVDGIVSTGGEANLINSIKLNDQVLSIVDKTVTIPVDTTLSDASENPIANRTVNAALSSISTQVQLLQQTVNNLDTGVSSVNTKTGDVTLYATDITISATNNDTIKDVLDLITSTIDDKADSGTTLADYGITDAYTKTQTDTAIATAIAGVTQIAFSVGSTLPSVGVNGTIYLIPNEASQGSTYNQQNVYDEYIYVNNQWEKIGTTDIDLSGYVKRSELVEATEAEIDVILAS